ncbi:MAG: hypothetical protein Q3M24_11600 [Candidatus Electrothrix aestuarii]|uniref:Cytochrome c7-like domain-containing protein n=1 Tax=Candidatus Electrothrix aestuarii TaxID=3062594 RepID=A0AAU8M2S5_9BACT
MRAAVLVGLFFVAISGLVLHNMPGEAVAQEDAAQHEESGAAVQEAPAEATQEEAAVEQEAPAEVAQEEPAVEQEAPADTAQEEPAVEQEAPADAAPATSAAGVECYESRKDATKILQVQNANPKYGYPNVKCSPTTGAVLWYGDPYTGTEPIGEMPKYGDKTDGDFAQAVIRPRTGHLKTIQQTNMQCSGCHQAPPQQTNPRQLMMHQDIVSDASKLQHGRGAIWCLDCHNAENRDTLIDQQGNEVSFNQSQKVCGSCHGDLYSDWRMGLHGKRTGEWKVGGKKRWWTCTECHNPHTVQEHRFDPVKPEPPPALPRGMSKDDLKGAEGHGGHGGGH